MKRILPFVIVAALIIALVYVNRGINRTDGVTSAAAQNAAKAAPPPSAPAASADSDILQPEQTIGNPAAAKTKITVGWIYDETTQPNSTSLIAALKAVEDFAQRSSGAVSAEIVDLDVPPTDRSPESAGLTSLGIQLNGKQIGPSVNPGTAGLTANIIQELLPAMSLHIGH